MSSSADRADRTDRADRADRTGGHESAALDEIELAGELMIAATASAGDRLPTARIDEVLLHPSRAPEAAAGHGGAPVSSAAAD
ncbi:hypothetical protein [Kitasatospora sp. GAS204B]|uniref:hypothetical protein n=1 Tax=unclassified Kitasatospora TaxID=2633591 RepID=UPI0024752235|nr:hypothetical protein [Kitasatospora sp. GAS204B]MDH6118255.1 hypothetical protein [Kitasatospora sp. GAS204B]